jgi:carboxymethylenebutenolidase
MRFTAAIKPGESTLHTSAQGLRHGQISVPSGSDSLPAYYAAPQSGTNLPVILVVQEIFGLHEHIQDVCRRFAHEGYLAIGAELYFRQGDAKSYTDIGKLLEEIVAKVPDEQVMSDLDACVQWAGQNGGDATRVGVTGFCWGGRITWLYAAHNPNCKAGVAWYGRLVRGHGPLQVRNPVDIAGQLHAPVLGLYGGRDAGIPQTEVSQMQEALSAAGAATARMSDIVVYPDSDHAFYADYRPSYNAADAQHAWGKALDWFGRYLK